MENDHPVPGEVQVGLDHVGPVLDSERKGLEGVLGSVSGCAAVGDGETAHGGGPAADDYASVQAVLLSAAVAASSGRPNSPRTLALLTSPSCVSNVSRMI